MMTPRFSDLDIVYRKNTFSLKPGTQIPGYTGHRPRVRFGFGSTYGDLTHQLNSYSSTDLNSSFFNSAKNTEKNKFNSEESSHRVYRNPKNNSSAMNKLLQGLDLSPDDMNRHYPFPTPPNTSPPTGLKSGYTGYVPRLRYHFGSSYNSSANQAQKEFDRLQQIDKSSRKEMDGSLESIMYSKYGQQIKKPLIPINDDEKILEELLKFEKQRKFAY